MEKMRQELKGLRRLPWPPELTPFKGNDHHSLTPWWSLLILNIELETTVWRWGNQFTGFFFDLP
jgi:hypothetical protein